MKTKKYKVYLTSEQREELLTLVSNSKNKAKMIRRANILLQLDENTQPVPLQTEIAAMFHISTPTIYFISKQFAEEGLQATLVRKERKTPPVKPKVTGDIEARLIAMSCSKAPEGYSRWTLRLIAEKAVELNIIDSISYKTVGEVLKKRT